MPQQQNGAARNHISSTADHTTTVLTVNLCVLAAGLTNRYLPMLVQAAVLLVLVPVGVKLLLDSNASIWVCVLVVLVSPVIVFCFSWLVAIPVGRMLGPFHPILGLNDYKRERIDLFLCALRDNPEFALVDTICVQECYNCIFFPGGYPEQLVAGAHAIGFHHAVLPSRCPTWPACFAQNSGLVILSKKRICRSASKSFGLSLEACGVNRGALYAGLEDGTHVFTCHVAPTASVSGSALLKWIFQPPVEASRRRQLDELMHFIHEHAPAAEPVIVAGDFNMDLVFPSFGAQPLTVPAAAAEAVVAMEETCGLVEASSQIRMTKDGKGGPLHFCRPTFGYTESPEWTLTSYGGGSLRHTCDDVVFYRGFVGSAMAEISMLIPPCNRPHASITHMSDHWAVSVKLTPAAAMPSADRKTTSREGVDGLKKRRMQ